MDYKYNSSIEAKYPNGTIKGNTMFNISANGVNQTGSNYVLGVMTNIANHIGIYNVSGLSGGIIMTKNPQFVETFSEDDDNTMAKMDITVLIKYIGSSNILPKPLNTIYTIKNMDTPSGSSIGWIRDVIYKIYDLEFGGAYDEGMAEMAAKFFIKGCLINLHS